MWMDNLGHVLSYPLDCHWYARACERDGLPRLAEREHMSARE
jgi:hypothetical protein